MRMTEQELADYHRRRGVTPTERNAISVEMQSLVDKANGYLALNELSQEKKEATAFFISSILHETGNYRGFSYTFHWENTDECRAKEYNRCYHYSERS